MNELVSQNQQLPATFEDLSKFILVGREKLISVRAEIRAIDKLNLAQEVRDQKREEAMMLSEALLDAEVKLGDLLKLIPKTPGLRTDISQKEPTDTAVHRFEKPKSEIIKDLGFTEKQKQRFETLADNKDLVEQVKAEARENDDIPTRSRVLDLVQQRKKREEEENRKGEDYSHYLDFCGKVAKNFNNVLYKVSALETNDQHLNAWKEFLDAQDMIQIYINQISESIPKLLKIKSFLKELKK